MEFLLIPPRRDRNGVFGNDRGRDRGRGGWPVSVCFSLKAKKDGTDALPRGPW